MEPGETEGGDIHIKIWGNGGNGDTSEGANKTFLTSSGNLFLVRPFLCVSGMAKST
jgi:hypothetical protein